MLDSRYEQESFSESWSPASLNLKWERAARLAWLGLAFIVLGFFLTSLPGYTLLFRGYSGHINLADPSANEIVFGAASVIASLGTALLSFFLAWTLFRLRFTETTAALLSFYLLGYGLVMAGPLESWSAYWLGNTKFAESLQALLFTTPTIAIFFLFPNGKFVPAWTRWVFALTIPFGLVYFIFPAYTVPSGEAFSVFFAVFAIFFLAFGATGIYAQVYRYRRISNQLEKKQTKWVLYGFILFLTYVVLSSIPYYYLEGLPAGAAAPWWAPASAFLWFLSLSIMPICLTIAITRFRLWNIDVVINRTLVYAALTTCIIGLYALIVGGAGMLLHLENNLPLSFLATGLAAVLFHPLRVRLQSMVNRKMYGERDEPVVVLTRLGEHLERTGTPEDILEGIVETVASALRLPYVAIEFGEDHSVAASYGLPVSHALRLPLVFRGDSVGELVVARRSGEDAFSPKDLQLLENIAYQAGAAAYNFRLTADLLRSRQRLVTAREEERRRIRRDLHDGLGPQLASQTLTLDAIENLLERDPGAARNLLKDLKSQSQTAIADIRSLIYDLRPPALDDLGFVEAIRQEFGDSLNPGTATVPGRLSVSFVIQGRLPELPAAVELAAYRIAQEALTNVVKHAQASSCRVRLEVPSNALLLEICDDGIGIPPGLRPGVGLHAMRERAEELGGKLQVSASRSGGTCVIARLPVVS